MTAECAIVGGGLAGFTAYQTLRHGGLAPDEIRVFGTDSDPAGAWRTRAAAIRQRWMRSESDGHCLATSFPGLAVREARRSRSLAPLVATVLDRYHPTVAQFLEHVAELRAAGNTDAATWLRLLVSEVYNVVGDQHAAWSGRSHALAA